MDDTLLNDWLAFGYDPGGNRKHGVAALRIHAGAPVAFDLSTTPTVEAAIGWFASKMNGTSRVALGADTLTVWSTGPSGWRPADTKLKTVYPAASNSVASSNSLYGAMSVNGMMLAAALRQRSPELIISETHPKVLHYALTSTLYDFQTSAGPMIATLVSWIGIAGPTPANDHEWDALASSFAVYQGISGRWTSDLHTLPVTAGETLVWPVGNTRFFWPDLPR